MSGRKHSDETKKIMSDTAKQIENPGRFKTGNQPANKGTNLSEKTRPRAEGAGKPSQQIEVTDITNNSTTTYDSIRETARALNIKHTRIVMYFSRNQTKPYKGQYIFNKL